MAVTRVTAGCFLLWPLSLALGSAMFKAQLATIGMCLSKEVEERKNKQIQKAKHYCSMQICSTVIARSRVTSLT